METKERKWLPYLVYALLSLAILGTLLLPGYILTLDMLFTPKMDFTTQFYGLSESISARTPLFLLLQLVSDIVPAWLLQKAILFLIFFLAGLGAHKLFPFEGAGSYFAGLLYTVNPFTYVRFMVGQWPLLAAYALIPFAVKAFLELLEKGGMRNTIKVTLLSTLVGLMLVHSLFLLFLIFLAIFVVKLISERKNPARLLQLSQYVGIATAMFLILNIYWLIPVLTAGTARLEQIGQPDLFLFAPRPAGNAGVVFSVASMYGFWNPAYIYALNFIPFWPVLFIIILFLTIYGFLSIFEGKNTRWVAISLASAGIIAFVLSLGITFKPTSAPFEWLFDKLVFFKGFRDSQKFVALLCLCYAYLGGLGVAQITTELKRKKRMLLRVGANIFIILALLVPLFYSFPIFGSWGQLKATDYPKEWYEVNDYLNQDKDDFNVLFLPWHQYMDYSWLPNTFKRLACPAHQFFDKPIIRPDNIEAVEKYSDSTNPTSKYVEFLLHNTNVSNWGELLAPLNVKYVLLVHEVDYTSYNFLYQQKDLTVDFEREGLTLFRNKHPIARAYGVESPAYIKNWEEYLRLSQTQDATEYLYIIGEGESSWYNTGMHKLGLKKKSPVKYQIANNSQRYVVFTVPQDVSTEHWEYDSQESMKNLGFMPAFLLNEKDGEVIYTRFYNVYLPSYIVSSITLALILGYYLFRRKGRV